MNRTNIFKLKQSISFEDLLFNLGFENINVNMKRCSCLLHGGDNKTSFSWNNDVYYCYGCGKSGDKISLVQEIKKYSFQEALQYLGNLAGIPIDIKPGKKQNFDRLEFPVQYAQFFARKTIIDYYDKLIADIEIEIDKLTESLKISRDKDLIEQKLYKLDFDIIYLNFQKGEIP